MKPLSDRQIKRMYQRRIERKRLEWPGATSAPEEWYSRVADDLSAFEPDTPERWYRLCRETDTYLIGGPGIEDAAYWMRRFRAKPRTELKSVLNGLGCATGSGPTWKLKERAELEIVRYRAATAAISDHLMIRKVARATGLHPMTIRELYPYDLYADWLALRKAFIRQARAEGETLREIGQRWDLSHQRIRQIAPERPAVKKRRGVDGEVLRQKRLDAGASYRALARAMNAHVSRVVAIERTKSVTDDVATRYLEALAVARVEQVSP